MTASTTAQGASDVTDSTLIGALVTRADREPDAPAVMEKRLGRWQPRTRGELLAEVAALAAALDELGVQAGDAVLSWLHEREYWVVVDLAVQSLGARTVALPAEAEPAEVGAACVEISAAWIVVQDADAVDAVLDLEEEGSWTGLRRIIHVETVGLQDHTDDRLAAMDRLLETGRGLDPSGTQLRDRIQGLHAEDVAVVVRSSGVRDAARFVELTHGQLLRGARAVLEAMDLGSDDRVLAVRPLADSTERTTTLYSGLLSGALLVLPEPGTALAATVHEIEPTYMHATARELDLLATTVEFRLRASRGVKGAVCRSWLRRSTRVVGGLLRWLVSLPVRDKLGLARIRSIVVSGAPLAPTTIALLAGLGLRVRSAYALSEAGGIVTVGDLTWGDDGPEDPSFCGRPLEGARIDIEGGEIVVAGPLVGGARVRPGDLGSIDERGVVLAGRSADQVTTVDGREVPAVQVEAALKTSPYVREAVVLRGADGPVAVLELFETAMQRWAAQHDLTFTTLRALVARREVLDFLRDDSEGRSPEAVELIVLPGSLSTVPGALDHSGKVRRRVLADALLDSDRAAASPSPPAS